MGGLKDVETFMLPPSRLMKAVIDRAARHRELKAPSVTIDGSLHRFQGTGVHVS